MLTHFRSPPFPPPPPTLSAPKNKRCDLPTTSCQSHLVKFMLTKSILLRGRTAVLFLFCSSWHNLVRIKITVRLHLLNRLFKCIQNSMRALLVPITPFRTFPQGKLFFLTHHSEMIVTKRTKAKSEEYRVKPGRYRCVDKLIPLS